MDYKFLAEKGIEKLFNDTELSVGEIMRSITQEKFTGIKIENRVRITEISDEKWYEIFEQVLNNETETEYFDEEK